MSSHPEPDAVPDFESWFREAARGLLRRAYFYTRDPGLAEDIAQEAVIKAYKAWADAETRTKILTQPAYLNAVVKNCYLDHVKVRSRTSQGEVELDGDWPGQATSTGENQDVQLAVLGLEGNEHELVVLVYYHDLTIGEAGTQLGLTQPQAYRLHKKALARLAGLLDEGER